MAVVEHDAVLRNRIGLAFADLGWDVLLLSDATALLDWLCAAADQASRIDCLVIELRRPDLNGLEVLAELRIQRRLLRTIVTTALADEQIKRVARALGASAVIAKPFATRDLCTAIRFLALDR